MPINIIDAHSLVITDGTLLIDKDIQVLTLSSSSNGTRSDSVVNMRDISAIVKGPDLEAKVPRFAELGSRCVGAQTSAGSLFCFHFDDASARDKFFTCLKIIRMSVDIAL